MQNACTSTNSIPSHVHSLGDILAYPPTSIQKYILAYHHTYIHSWTTLHIISRPFTRGHPSTLRIIHTFTGSTLHTIICPFTKGSLIIPRIITVIDIQEKGSHHTINHISRKEHMNIPSYAFIRGYRDPLEASCRPGITDE